MKKPLAILTLALAVTGIGAGSALAAPPAPSDSNPAERSAVCHITGSAKNPVVVIYVPGNANPPRKACAPSIDAGVDSDPGIGTF